MQQAGSRNPSTKQRSISVGTTGYIDMTDASEQTMIVKMSDGDLEGMYKVIRESSAKQEARLMESFKNFGHAVDLLSEQILDLKRRFDAMEKWVESKREQGL